MGKKMIYQENHINISREELLLRLKQVVTEKRYKHILRVEATALEIGKKFDVSLEKISIAALLHDYAKDMPKEAMLRLAEANWPEGNLSQGNDNIWHGFASAEIAKNEFKVHDLSILKAIAYHTIGGYDMDLLAKIIFVADFIEPGRTFDGVEKARKLAKNNFDQALIYKLSSSIIHTIENRQTVFPHSLLIYNQWIQKVNKKEEPVLTH